MVKFNFSTQLWTRIALINFCVTALAGVTLRYKINFPLPSINQKYLLHSHSHFAFVGWVTLALMALMVHYLVKNNLETNYKKYHIILAANCITAYGMLITFLFQGYDVYSITFSTLSIFVSYIFIYYYWLDLNKLKNVSHTNAWFKASLAIWAFSSLGAFSLAFLMANKILIQDLYFSAIYFYLHFQYNGWFLFACFGLLFAWLYRSGIIDSVVVSKPLFKIMAYTVVPTYLLSIIWLKLPTALHWIANISAVLQLLVLFYFVKLFLVIKKDATLRLPGVTRLLWTMAAIAFVIKICLQLLSISPELSQYAFGYRPVIIGYLHLSFLGVISFFILGFIEILYKSMGSKLSKAGIYIFVSGVLLQEIILMVQGLEAINVERLPYANIILLASACIMLLGLLLIALRTYKRVNVAAEKQQIKAG